MADPDPFASDAELRAAALDGDEIAVVDVREGDARISSQGRTVYLLDVRTAEEYAAGHLPGAISAPGGQLVQTTDRFGGVRQAEIVLVDDPDLVRARLAAHWLYQQGLPRVSVYPAATEEPTEAGFPPLAVPDDGPEVATISAKDLSQRLAAGDAQ